MNTYHVSLGYSSTSFIIQAQSKDDAFSRLLEWAEENEELDEGEKPEIPRDECFIELLEFRNHVAEIPQ